MEIKTVLEVTGLSLEEVTRLKRFDLVKNAIHQTIQTFPLNICATNKTVSNEISQLSFGMVGYFSFFHEKFCFNSVKM